MDRHRIVTLAAALICAVALVLALVGCQPPNPNVRTVVGDSLTMTTLLDGHLQGYDVHSMLGWEAEDAQPGLTDRVADPTRSPARVAIALCANDAAQHTGKGPEWGDGFTTTDQAQLRQLRKTLHPATLVVWVLPDYNGTDPLFAAGINACRAWLTAAAAEAGDCVADWRAVNGPADIDPDGVHLTTQGKARYGAMIDQAVTTCG